MALIHRWQLTENANDTVGTLNFTNNGGVTFSADGALFNASTKWLSCTLPTRTVGSWVAWVKPTTYTQTQVGWVACRSDGFAGAGWQGFGVRGDNSSLRFSFNPTNADAVGYFSPAYMPLTSHSLLVYTFDSNYIRGYLNGKLVAQIAHTPLLSNIGTSFGIGTYGGNNYDAPNWNFQGYVRGFEEHDNALSAADVAALTGPLRLAQVF